MNEACVLRKDDIEYNGHSYVNFAKSSQGKDRFLLKMVIGS